MTEFAFLFRGSGSRAASAEQQQKTMQKWAAWMKDLHERGLITNPGHPLEGSGQVVSGRGRMVHDGPFAEVKDVINGFMTIRAANLAEAVEISKGCPIFERDGSVEVRPVLQFTP